MHEVLKELLDIKLPKVTKQDWADSDELRTDLSRLIDRLPELCNAADVAYALRALIDFKARIAA